MNLTLRQLAVFREVMRSGSMSKAARTVGRTQPAVSTMIATLEEDLGFALFQRDHGKLTPTPEAQYFLEEAEAILARLDRSKQALARIGTLRTGRLRIACHPAASGVFLPRLLTGFLADKREVDLSLIMQSSSVIEDLVASQQFDIGFTETPRPRASILQTDFDLESVCLLRADDPLARKSALGPEDLDGKPMAFLLEDLPGGTGAQRETRSEIEMAFLSRGKTFNKRIALRTSLPGLEFVAEGLCYMICDMITAYGYLQQNPASPKLAIRRFLPRIGAGVSILRPAHVSPSRLAQAFAAHLEAGIETMRHEMKTVLDQSPPDPAGTGPNP